MPLSSLSCIHPRGHRFRRVSVFATRKLCLTDSTHVMARGLWPLTEVSRKKIVDRVTANLSKLSFFTEQVGPCDFAQGRWGLRSFLDIARMIQETEIPHFFVV